MHVRSMVSIASIPSREESLQRVVESLLPQAEGLNIYLNGYPNVPGFLRHPKITVARSDDYGDLGDAGKFFWLSEDARYFLFCDDDIIYPPHYVEQTIAAIERYGRRAVIGWHGSILQNDFREYYQDRTILSFYRDLECDTPVHILGTGTVGFHASTIRLTLEDFRIPNMADVWFGLKAQEQHIPLIVRAHRAGELVPILQSAQDTAIWRDCIENADSRRNTRRFQNEAVMAHAPWHIYECRPVVNRFTEEIWLALGVLGIATLVAAGKANLSAVLVAVGIVALAYGIKKWRRRRNSKTIA